MPWYLWVICAAAVLSAVIAGTIVVIGIEAFTSIVDSVTGRDRAHSNGHDGDDAA